MKRHLSPQELVDAADGVLASSRMRHVDRCEACRTGVADLRQAIDQVKASSDVPEPSPLFWDHLPARVRRATADEPIRTPWWGLSGWRVLAVVAPATIVVLVMVAVERQLQAPAGSVRVPAPPVVELESPAPMAPTAGDVPPAWSEVAALTAAVSPDELSGAAPLRAGTADALIEDLTADERAELLRLLKEAMGGGA